MPKRYRVEMSLVEEPSGTSVDSASQPVEYETEAEAKAAFREKVKAAEKGGGGQGSETA